MIVAKQKKLPWTVFSVLCNGNVLQKYEQFQGMYHK